MMGKDEGTEGAQDESLPGALRLNTGEREWGGRPGTDLIDPGALCAVGSV